MYPLKNKYGQYFTPAEIANFMIDLADLSPSSSILEPCCGEGVFLKLLSSRNFNNVTALEIDTNLATWCEFVRYESFVSAELNQKFDLIIGNPPYIRWKNLEPELKQELELNYLWNKYFNSLCDYLFIFILKSIELLNEGGQLIFICPEYWLNTTHSINLRNYMVENGEFESIYHFNETPLFDNVNSSILVFKYVKGHGRFSNINVIKYYGRKKVNEDFFKSLLSEKKQENVSYFTIPQFEKDKRWLLTDSFTQNNIKKLEFSCKKNFNNLELDYYTIGDFCDIGNGLVSGMDKAFQLDSKIQLNEYEEKAILNVIKAKDLSPYIYNNVTRYIFVNGVVDEEYFISLYPSFYSQLSEFTSKLNNRYNYNRNINYWEWVFLRSFNLFNRKEKRIFVPCKERISNKDYFRFSLIGENIFPTQDVTAIFCKHSTKESIEYIVAYLNMPEIFEWLKYNGIVKGNIVEFSEAPLSSIPFRAIKWNSDSEIKIHNLITNLVHDYCENPSQKILVEIRQLFNQLFKW